MVTGLLGYPNACRPTERHRPTRRWRATPSMPVPAIFDRWLTRPFGRRSHGWRPASFPPKELDWPRVCRVGQGPRAVLPPIEAKPSPLKEPPGLTTAAAR